MRHMPQKTTVNDNPLRVLALICTLKKSPERSSSELLATQLLDEFAKEGVLGESLRTVDYAIAAGVTEDEGDGDQWPGIRARVLAADILLLCAPIWMGHASSEAHRVLERLDAELGNHDDEGRAILAGKVAVTAIVGNEDGAHKATADIYQALADVGFSIPSQGGTYWTGQAMKTVDYQDLEHTPREVSNANQLVVSNATHLARVLRDNPYPPRG